MKTNRIKLTAPVLKTFADLEADLGEIRELTIERKFLAADCEARLKEVDDRYGYDITRLNEQLAAKTELVKAWAHANPDAFGGKKTLDTTHASIGWRKGQWQIAALTGWIWQRT